MKNLWVFIVGVFFLSLVSSLSINIPVHSSLNGTETDPVFLTQDPNLARTGTCPSGSVVQNTTTGGVQCLSISGITDTNETTRFNALVNVDCPAGSLVIGVQSNGTVLCATDSTGGGNSSWNESYANNLYYPKNANPNTYYNSSTIPLYALVTTMQNYFLNGTNINMTILQLYLTNGTTVNQTFTDARYLQTESDPRWTPNSTLYPKNTSFNTTQFLNPTTTGNITINQSWLSSIATGDNSSWNESRANVLYAPITEPLWTNNQTSYAKNVSFNSTQFTTTTNITIKESWLDSLFTTVSEVVTQIGAYFNQNLNTTSSPTFVNLTVTNLSSSNVFASNLCYTNGTNCPASSGNSSWNQSLANRLYANATGGNNLTGKQNITVTSGQAIYTNGDIISTGTIQGTTLVGSIDGGYITNVVSYISTWLGLTSTDSLPQGSTNLYDNKSWNESYANTLYGAGGIRTINQTYTDYVYGGGSPEYLATYPVYANTFTTEGDRLVCDYTIEVTETTTNGNSGFFVDGTNYVVGSLVSSGSNAYTGTTNYNTVHVELMRDSSSTGRLRFEWTADFDGRRSAYTRYASTSTMDYTTDFDISPTYTAGGSSQLTLKTGACVFYPATV